MNIKGGTGPPFQKTAPKSRAGLQVLPQNVFGRGSAGYLYSLILGVCRAEDGSAAGPTHLKSAKGVSLPSLCRDVQAGVGRCKYGVP